MIGNLFKRAPGGGAHRPQAPEGQRIYAVGDIHGRLDLLEDLLGRIDRDSAGAARRLVFLGDYVDRGPDSRGVLERLAALAAAEPTAVFLKGNHEAAMLDFLDAPADGDAWLSWGGAETLESYGIAPRLTAPPEALAEDLRRALPPAHGAFLRSLRLSFTAGDYFFVHAGVRPGAALADQKEEDLLWIRDAFHGAKPEDRPAETIVHGHHPTRKPVDEGWRIGVDTGAVWTGVLSAAVLEGAERRFLSTDRA